MVAMLLLGRWLLLLLLLLLHGLGIVRTEIPLAQLFPKIVRFQGGKGMGGRRLILLIGRTQILHQLGQGRTTRTSSSSRRRVGCIGGLGPITTDSRLFLDHGGQGRRGWVVRRRR